MSSINNNKESFELLRGAPDSNSNSEVSEVVFPVRKKRYRRRLKNNPSTKHEDSSNDFRCRASTVSLTLFCSVLICWLVTLTWLAVVLHGQLNRLNIDVAKEMDSVANVNVPLRGGKKMKKRKELDALVSHAINKRCVDVKRSSIGGISSHDQLLSESTDEQDYWTSSTGGKPPRCHRRRYSVRKRTCSALLRACSGILVFSCFVATTAVMWLFIDVREQVTSLRIELNQVVAGNQGVPDALQKCHSLSRDLQKNQSQIMDRLNGFSYLLNNFSLEVTEVKNGLHTVQNQLKSSPDLINNPTIVKDLSTSVASFGSQIKDLEATVSSLKDQHLKLDNIVNNLLINVSDTTELVNANKEKVAFTEKNFAAEKDKILAIIGQVSINVTSVNDALSNKLRYALDDFSKDHKVIEMVKESNANVTSRITYLEGLCAKERKEGAAGEEEEPLNKSSPGPEISSPSPSPSRPQEPLFPFKSDKTKLSKKSENPI